MKSSARSILKRLLIAPLLALCAWHSTLSTAEAQGTAFTYQGFLNLGGLPVNGSYDLTFQLFTAATNGVGLEPVVTNSAIAVNNGLFTVLLDFGAGVFTGTSYWVEIGVRTNGGGAFASLSPLLPLTPAPYAITAGTASNALTATALSGTVSSGNLTGAYGSPVTFSNAGNMFAGNGAGLTNLANVWNLTGNASTTPGAQFLGTTDTNALEFHVNGARALRLEPNTNGFPNVIGGSSADSVAPGNFGATIGGGNLNVIQGNSGFATIGGGANNAESNAPFSTIAGGVGNISSGAGAFIGGGGYDGVDFLGNSASGAAAVIGGGFGNTNGGVHGVIGGGFRNTIESNIFDPVIAGGTANTIQSNANASFIGGGFNNIIQSNAGFSVIAGGYLNSIQSNTFDSVIGGGEENTIQSNISDSVIAGGRFNSLQGDTMDSVIAGGTGNTMQSNVLTSVIGGGLHNVIQTNVNGSGIGAGAYNTIGSNAQFAVIPGGSNNVAAGNYSFAAGQQAQALHQGAFVWADSSNAPFASTTNDQFLIRAAGGVGINTNNPNGAALSVNGAIVATSFIGSGAGLTMAASNIIGGVLTNKATNVVLTGAFTGNGAGLTNLPNVWTLNGNAGTTSGAQFLGTTDTNALELHVNGARAMRLEPNTNSPNIIGGYGGNSVTPGIYGATIAGGGASGSNINTIGANFATVGGGSENNSSGQFATIAGGSLNFISAQYGTLGGGYGSYISGDYGTVGGGQQNQSQGNYTTIAGGQQNICWQNYTTVGGGLQNESFGEYATVGGGENNESTGFASTTAGGQNNQGGNDYATVGGGYQNICTGAGGFIGGGGADGISSIGNSLDGNAATIVGGMGNSNNGDYASIGGGYLNTIQSGALCAVIPGGSNNIVSGNFSFAAGTSAQATNDNAFVWGDGSADTASITNNQFLVRASGGVILYSSSANTAGVSLAAGSGTWSSLSDRDAKDNFAPVTSQDVLAKVAELPITKWSYKTEQGVRHIGPMAQDFYAAFNVGEDDRHITSVDEEGVALAAIQGLNQKLEAESKAKDAEIKALEQRLERLEKMMAHASR